MNIPKPSLKEFWQHSGVRLVIGLGALVMAWSTAATGGSVWLVLILALVAGLYLLDSITGYLGMCQNRIIVVLIELLKQRKN